MQEMIERLLGKSMTAYRTEIQKRNAEVTDKFLLFGMVLSIMILAVQTVMRRESIIYTNVIMFAYFLILYIVRRVTSDKIRINGTVLLYMIQIPMVLFAILMGTVWDPGREAFTILVLLASFPLCILDKPYRLLLYILGSVAVFLVIDASVKTPELFHNDLNHIISSGLVSLATSMFVLRDRTESLRNYIAVRDQSQTDALTGIWNRSHGQSQIQDQLDSRIPGACILVDVDDFKHVNDVWGHIIGDDVLRQTAESLNDVFSDSIVCRYGGDEFVIYMNHADEEMVRTRMKQVSQRLEKKTGWKHLPVHIRLSTGCLIQDGSCASVFRLLSEADKALYTVKRTEKGTVHFRYLQRP